MISDPESPEALAWAELQRRGTLRPRYLQGLEEEMHQAAKELRFEYAARLRDEVHELRKELRQLKEAGVA